MAARTASEKGFSDPLTVREGSMIYQTVKAAVGMPISRTIVHKPISSHNLATKTAVTIVIKRDRGYFPAAISSREALALIASDRIQSYSTNLRDNGNILDVNETTLCVDICSLKSTSYHCIGSLGRKIAHIFYIN